MNNIKLTGAAQDTIHALFFRGCLPSGDLPSKCGAAELRQAGLAETDTFCTSFMGEDYFTFLTEVGQRFAIEYFARSRFGE